MLSRYYTMDEFQRLKFYELPTYLYKRILEDLRRVLGYLTPRMISAFDNSPLWQLDQFVDIYRYIVII